MTAAAPPTSGGADMAMVPRRPATLRPWIMLAPLPAFLAAFFLAPLGRVLVMSVTDPEPGIGHYTAIASDGFLLRVLGQTFMTAALVAFLTLLVGFPLAYAMAEAPPRGAALLMVLVTMSFWTSFLVRTYAWMVTCGFWEDTTESLDSISRWRDLCAANADIVEIAKTAADVRRIAAAGKLAIILGFQNTELFGNRIRLVELFAELGVRCVQLTYNNQNCYAGRCYEAEDSGLARFDRELIIEMTRAGILVDLSDVGNHSTLDADRPWDPRRRLRRRLRRQARQGRPLDWFPRFQDIGKIEGGLKAAGCNAEEVATITHGKWLRVYQAVWGG